MKRRGWVTAALVSACAWWAFAQETPQGGGEINDLAWLAGAWAGTIDGGTWEAVYSTPAGGEIVSANKELRDGRVTMIEFEHFRTVEDKLVLTPFPFGKRSSASFTLSALDRTAKRAVFSNPAHDFPREITYHRADEDRLVITVTGEQDGKSTTLTLDLRRQD